MKPSITKGGESTNNCSITNVNEKRNKAHAMETKLSERDLVNVRGDEMAGRREKR